METKSKYILIAVLAFALLCVIVVLACIPLYISSAGTTTVVTTAEMDNLASLSVSKRRRRNVGEDMHINGRQSLVGSTQTVQTTTMDTEMTTFLAGEGATNIVILWTANSGTYVFIMKATVTFTTVVTTGSNYESLGTNLVAALTTSFVAKTSAGTLLSPSSAPAGATLTPTTDVSQITVTVTQVIGGVVTTAAATTVADTTAEATTVAETTTAEETTTA